MMASGFLGSPDYMDSPDLPLNDDSVLPPVMSGNGVQTDGGNEDEGNLSPPRPPRLMVTPTPDKNDAAEDEDGGGGAQFLPQIDGSHSDSLAATHSEGGWTGAHKGGFNLRHYEEELNKLKKDNLSLKLRIYLMEEKYGLLGKPEEKENVYK